MWIQCSDGDYYWIDRPSKKTLKRRKQRKNKRMNIELCCLPPCTPIVSNPWNINYLGSSPTQSPVAVIPAQKKGKPMCYDCDCESESSVDNRKLTYAQNRVETLKYLKRSELRKMFRLDVTVPQTGEELVDAIKNGKYTVRTSKEIRESGEYIYSVLSYFKWRAPDDKPDQAGYDVADKELDKLIGDVSDTVTLGDFAQQRTALQSLSDWQPSNKPS